MEITRNSSLCDIGGFAELMYSHWRLLICTLHIYDINSLLNLLYTETTTNAKVLFYLPYFNCEVIQHMFYKLYVIAIVCPIV